MRKRLALVILTMAGCSNPALHAGISLDSNGVSISPAVTGSVGGARVMVQP